MFLPWLGWNPNDAPEWVVLARGLKLRISLIVSLVWFEVNSTASINCTFRILTHCAIFEKLFYQWFWESYFILAFTCHEKTTTIFHYCQKGTQGSFIKNCKFYYWQYSQLQFLPDIVKFSYWVQEIVNFSYCTIGKLYNFRSYIEYMKLMSVGFVT